MAAHSARKSIIKHQVTPHRNNGNKNKENLQEKVKGGWTFYPCRPTCLAMLSTLENMKPFMTQLIVTLMQWGLIRYVHINARKLIRWVNILYQSASGWGLRSGTKLYIPNTINVWKKVHTKAIWADKKWTGFWQIRLVQGLPFGFDTKYLSVADRNMHVRFGLKVVWESWVGRIWLMTLWFG